MIPGLGTTSYFQNWPMLFGFKNQFGTPVFSKGTGTLFPSPSIPIAQAFRYYWAAKSWRCNYSITTNTPFTYTYDTGFIPYGTGKSSGAIPGAVQRRWMGNFGKGGDTLAAPSYDLRIIGDSTGDGIYQDVFARSSNNDTVAIQILSPIQLEFSQPMYGTTIAPVLVFDPIIPGNVFMQFWLQWNAGGGVGLTTLKSGSASITPVICTLDGISIDLYGDPSVTTSGSIVISTRDS